LPKIKECIKGDWLMKNNFCLLAEIMGSNVRRNSGSDTAKGKEDLGGFGNSGF
jgi:hypothetical protein